MIFTVLGGMTGAGFGVYVALADASNRSMLIATAAFTAAFFTGRGVDIAFVRWRSGRPR